MSYELRKQFSFDAAHTLEREIGTESSRRIHGHSYRGELVLRGEIDPASGMLVDFGHIERVLAGLRDALDHRFLDEVEGLGPATMENLCRWIWTRARPALPQLQAVAVYRDSAGERCTYLGPAA